MQPYIIPQPPLGHSTSQQQHLHCPNRVIALCFTIHHIRPWFLASSAPRSTRTITTPHCHYHDKLHGHGHRVNPPAPTLSATSAMCPLYTPRDNSGACLTPILTHLEQPGQPCRSRTIHHPMGSARMAPTSQLRDCPD